MDASFELFVLGECFALSFATAEVEVSDRAGEDVGDREGSSDSCLSQRSMFGEEIGDGKFDTSQGDDRDDHRNPGITGSHKCTVENQLSADKAETKCHDSDEIGAGSDCLCFSR